MSQQVKFSLIFLKVQNTRIRSTVVGGGFIAYGVGGMAMYGLNLIETSSSGMALVSLLTIMVFWSVPLIVIKESTKWLYVKGKFGWMGRNSEQISKMNKMKFNLEEYYKMFIGSRKEDIELIQNMGEIWVEEINKRKQGLFRQLGGEIFLNRL